MTKKTSTFSNALIWFGAGVSIAEILTGTYFAGLGFKKALLAILLGHLIGGVMMLLAGLIGGFEEKSAMETVSMSFGTVGCKLFAILNVLQLLGWTAIMTYDGAVSAQSIFHMGVWFWALIMGVLILIWILVGVTNLGKLSLVSMVLLLILSVILFKLVFFSGNSMGKVSAGTLTFGGAVELAVSMPLSWLPLISDYTREAEKPAAAAAASVVTYSIVSVFMFVIGMGASLFTGETNIAVIMTKAGLGIAGLLIVILSTVTTTFLDAYSAGVSSVTVYHKINEKHAALIVTIIGTAGAMMFNMDNITNFLYFIGSVFAPMIAVQAADYFILKRADCEDRFNRVNLIVWLIGFILYRWLMTVNTPVGNTLPDFVITMVICVIANLLAGRGRRRA
ncbi:putative hydroxymethylpyrimidine transporter CytX [Eubacterium sp. F2]|uniref:putative hydroxymethylpyrimidine transporter CytX n=1 Tax=Eubacterium sp. F2 TaxID=3381348 RepID=UPI0039082866